ncbi:MAG: TetR/AcrR family transcriptional regulator [Ilumatobacteraceae bacterium]|nr:TetR/AcrR family transcriptional regulator [Ilumatobacteraceae bacterium]
MSVTHHTLTADSATADKPMRADARRNRQRLLAAAIELFNDGDDVTLEAVARQAGVGIGTLYRHFPTRDDLVEAAYRNEVAQLHDAATELLETLPPDEALAAWMHRFVTYAATKNGMRDALQSVVASNSGLSMDTRRRMIAAIDALLSAGVTAGTLRADVDAEDVLFATGGIWQVTADERWRDRAERMVGLIVDGIRRVG